MSTTGSAGGTEVTVRSTYRIHMGFYRFLDNGLVYGALGAAIEEPQLIVTARECEGLSVRAESSYTREVISNVCNYLGVKDVCITVSGYVRHHVGLGSTTRLVMATLTALSTLKRLDVDVIESAFSLGRGRVSSIGIYTFMYGNLVVDSGRSMLGRSGGRPKPIAILPVPRDWYVIVAVPEDYEGLSEDEESKIMGEPRRLPEQDLLYKYLVMLMSSLTQGDFQLFSKSLSSIQELTGKYFSEYQGGTFCCGISAEIVELLRSSGVKGVGQSSWGPTVYGFTNSYVKAIEVRNSVSNYLRRKGVKGKVWITNVAQVGHRVDITLGR